MQTASLQEFNEFAREFASTLVPHSAGATVVALSGELGAGKTAFVQEVAKYFGVAESVTSPTFVIEKVYALSGQPFGRLIHIDAYRLGGSRELEVLGWQELVGNERNLILLEWPERVPELIPEGSARLHFDIEGERRIITQEHE